MNDILERIATAVEAINEKFDLYTPLIKGPGFQYKNSTHDSTTAGNGSKKRGKDGE